MGFRVECNITQRCNARCDHCNKAVGYADKAFPDMTLEQVRRAVDQLLEQKVKIRRFTFCGGEPVLHRDLQEMICEVDRLPTLWLGRVLTNALPASQHLRDKIVLPRRFKWVENPLDDPQDPLSGKNDGSKRPNKRYHLPFWVSPADVGLESRYDNCRVKYWCGVGLDASGWSMCGKAQLIGDLVGVPGAGSWDVDIYKYSRTGIEDICKHCQYGLGGVKEKFRGMRVRPGARKIAEMVESGELPSDGVSDTFRAAFDRHNLVQVES